MIFVTLEAGGHPLCSCEGPDNLNPKAKSIGFEKTGKHIAVRKAGRRALFDHPVGPGEQRGRDFEAERLRSFEIDD
jgi:hypothetical protein